MKTNIVLFLVLFGLLLPLSAQQPAAPASTPSSKPAPPPLPPGPLLNPAPKFAQWVITVKNAAPSAPNTGADKKSQSKPEPPAAAMAVVKTAPIVHVISMDGSGQRSEQWRTKDLIIALPPRGAPPVVSGIDGASEANADFPGFEWISLGNYTDLVRVNGRDAIVFKDKLGHRSQEGIKLNNIALTSGVAVNNDKIEVTAYVDLLTRLPLTLQLGGEYRTYQFGATPSTMQTLPPELQKAAQDMHARFQQASTMPRP